MVTSIARSIEESRQVEQARLDALKTAAERNKWGQFATPTPLALSLAAYAQSFLGEHPIRFLDPSIGTGSFFFSSPGDTRRGQARSSSGRRA
jgi:adenine-specific DNA-methyltransferase